MTHQYVTRANAIVYIEGRADKKLSHTQLEVEHRGSNGVDYVEDIDEAIETVLEHWQNADLAKYSSDQKRDELEGELAVPLYEGLQDLPAEVLTDKDFWRYLSAALYDFVVWRQNTTKTVTGLFPYFGVASNGLGRECVPHRMFNRAYIVGVAGKVNAAADPFELARIGAADMWKSHVLRVANGNAPLVVHEFATDVKAGNLPTDILRPMVKNLRRVRSNVLFEVLDPHQARDLVDRETERTKRSMGLLDDEEPDD